MLVLVNMATNGTYRLELEPQKKNVFVTQLRYKLCVSLFSFACCALFSGSGITPDLPFDVAVFILSSEMMMKMTATSANFPSLKR